MARVTDIEVKEILDTAIDTTPFITQASLLVDRLDGSQLSTSELKEIERNLAAHLACAKVPRLLSKTIGRATKQYQRSGDGLMLDSTPYGQAAKLLDKTGVLESLGKRMAQLETLDCY